MQKITKYLISNIIMFICFVAIYVMYRDNKYMFFDINILMYLSAVLLLRAVIFGSDSSMLISLVIGGICAIIYLSRLGIVPSYSIYAYMLICVCICCVVVGAIYRHGALMRVGNILPLSVLLLMYLYNYITFISAIASGIIYSIILICIHYNHKGC